MTIIDVEVESGTTVAVEIPPELGAAFAAVVAEVIGWSTEQVKHFDAFYSAWCSAARDSYWDSMERVDRALEQSEVTSWPCTFLFPGADQAAWAGPYLDTVYDTVFPGAAELAGVVLARDVGLVTAADFTILTSWWVAAGLPLPPARDGAVFAVDQAEAMTRARTLGVVSAQFEPGWPGAAPSLPEGAVR